MKAGFREWLYRWLSAVFGIVAVLFSLSALEISRLYGFPRALLPSGIALALSFLILVTAFVGTWSWKRYTVLSAVFAALFGLPYLALRPEMLRDDVLKQLSNPPLSVDLVIYRGWALKDDPEKTIKVERLNFVYGLIHSYGERRHPPISETK